jgi:hypothetical protein
MTRLPDSGPIFCYRKPGAPLWHLAERGSPGTPLTGRTICGIELSVIGLEEEPIVPRADTCARCLRVLGESRSDDEE